MIVKVVRDKSLPGKPVIALSLGGEDASDDTIRRLAAFTHLKTLTICYAPLTAKGFQHLANLKTLEDLTVTFLELRKNKPAFLAFQKLPNLRSLNISVTEVTDADLDYLKDMTHLRTLRFDTRMVHR